MSHALAEISVLEERLARVRETFAQKQAMAAQFEAEEHRRKLELEQIKAAVEEESRSREAEEQKRMLAIEEESARLKAAVEKEAARRKAENEELTLEELKLEEALARVQAHSFRSVAVHNASSIATSATSAWSLFPTAVDAHSSISEFQVESFQLFPSGLLHDRVEKLAAAVKEECMPSRLQLPGADDTHAPADEALAVLASTPPPQDISTVEDWLRSINLQRYTTVIKDYGYDSLAALDTALEEHIEEMINDPAVDMKKPHRHLFMDRWKKRIHDTCI